MPRSRKPRRFVSLPARTRLSRPTISQSGHPSRRPRAMVLPTKPQMPVIRMRMWLSLRLPVSSFWLQSFAPGGGDLIEDLREVARQVPLRIVRFHFAQVAVIADVVAAARLVQVSVDWLPAGAGLRHFKGFQDGAGVVLAAAEIIDLAGARRLGELEHEARHIRRMDIVADLFAFVAVNLVFAAFEIALHQVAEEAVQLDA